jgi:hypothetical protein
VCCVHAWSLEEVSDELRDIYRRNLKGFSWLLNCLRMSWLCAVSVALFALETFQFCCCSSFQEDRFIVLRFLKERHFCRNVMIF